MVATVNIIFVRTVKYWVKNDMLNMKAKTGGMNYRGNLHHNPKQMHEPKYKSTCGKSVHQL
jgi:hypothetical protein